MTTPTAIPSRRLAPRLLRAAAIGLMALVFVALLPIAPAQPTRDLGAVRANPTAQASQSPPVVRAADLPYRPFIDPVRLPVHQHWYVLLIPMSFGIAVVYKAVMMQSIERYWQQVAYLTVQIIVGMILLAIASYLLVMVYVPFMAAR